LSEVIVKNGGGRMLEQPLLMNSTLWASARSLGFPMGYNVYEKRLQTVLLNEMNNQAQQNNEKY